VKYKGMGYMDVHALRGGVEGWKKAGYRVIEK